MQDAGIISDAENFGLIEGEIVPMQANTHVHELIKSALNIAIVQALPERLWLGVETTIYLSANTFVEPDFVVYPKGIKLEEIKGSTSCSRSRSR
jgi:Putative restriction endonuclease